MDERDQIDELIDTLNDACPGIVFERDALEVNRPEDWAAVEMTGSESQWADGVMVDQVLKCEVWVCLNDRRAGVRKRVQAALARFSAAHEGTVGWEFTQRAYMYELDKVVWKWTVWMDGPIDDATWPGEQED